MTMVNSGLKGLKGRRRHIIAQSDRGKLTESVIVYYIVMEDVDKQ